MEPCLPRSCWRPRLAIAGAAVGMGLWRVRRWRTAAPSGPAARAARVQDALATTRRRLLGGLGAALRREGRPVDATLAELEEALVGADVRHCRRPPIWWLAYAISYPDGRRTRAFNGRSPARSPGSSPGPPPPVPTSRPWVVLVTGVNGVGQDHDDREAGGPARTRGTQGTARRRRHLPRGRHRPAGGYGPSAPARIWCVTRRGERRPQSCSTG